MKPKWIIENYDPDSSADKLIAEVKRQGYQYESVQYLPFESGKYDKFPVEDCVIFYGSINLALQLSREKQYVPGPWLTTLNYDCRVYYTHLGKYLFNNDYIMLTMAEAKRRKEGLYKEGFGRPLEYLFFRPSSGLKPFTARVIDLLNFDSCWSWFEEFTDPDAIIIIARPKIILGEWRFICAEHEIITGCQYHDENGTNYKKGYHSQAWELANTIAKEKFQPDPMFTIDICQSGEDNKFYLLEINSFSCAGLYACDIEPIVTTANRLALRDWEDIYNVPVA